MKNQNAVLTVLSLLIENKHEIVNVDWAKGLVTVRVKDEETSCDESEGDYPPSRLTSFGSYLRRDAENVNISDAGISIINSCLHDNRGAFEDVLNHIRQNKNVIASIKYARERFPSLSLADGKNLVEFLAEAHNLREYVPYSPGCTWTPWRWTC